MIEIKVDEHVAFLNDAELKVRIVGLLNKYKTALTDNWRQNVTYTGNSDERLQRDLRLLEKKFAVMKQLIVCADFNVDK